MATVEAWGRAVARGPGWYWVAAHTRNGDLYCICSLARAFKELHGGDHPMRLVVSTRNRVDVASLFEEYFDEIIVDPEFANTPVEYWDLVNRLQVPPFGLSVPLMLQPHLREDTFLLTRFVETYGLTWMEVYKHILQLPAYAEPATPASRPDRVEAARALCEEHGVVQGRTVIFFPFAQSLVVDALSHFARLAVDLQAKGYQVLTGVAPGEAPIEGTSPIFIPFPLLIDVAEYAGWVVMVRSGLSDILSSAGCRKTVVFRRVRDMREWSVAAMGLCQDAAEIVFDFRVASPALFSETVIAGDSLDAIVGRPSGLSGLVDDGPDPSGKLTIEFSRLQRRPNLLAEELAKAGDHVGGGGLMVVRGVPSRGHPGWRPLVIQLFHRLGAQMKGRTFFAYVCQDVAGPDFFEEVEPGMLLKGQYSRAEHTHSVLISAAALESRVPPFGRDFILALECTPPDETVAMVADAVAPTSLEALDAKPSSVRGFQLLNGWAAPEDWGVWSSGRRSVLKFTLQAPPGRGGRLVLACRGSVSAVAPVLEFGVSVNGQATQTAAIRHGEGDLELVIPIPDHLAARERSFLVGFEFSGLRSPRQQGQGIDPRLLGIGLRTARIETAAGRG